MPHPTSAPIQDDDGGGRFRFQKKQRDCNCCCCCSNRWEALLASCHAPCSSNPESPLLCATAIFLLQMWNRPKAERIFLSCAILLDGVKKKKNEGELHKKSFKMELCGIFTSWQCMGISVFSKALGTCISFLSLSRQTNQTRRWTVALESKQQPGMSLLSSFLFWKTN
jgi:hypothetical protein